MARRRYVSTMISQDTRVNKLAVKYGDFAALLYTWMIPHAADDATLPGDPEELLYQVVPGRRDKTEADVQAALDGMAALGLISATEDGRIMFPPVAFYRYQPYIKSRNRHGEDDAPTSAQDQPEAEASTPRADSRANQRKSAQNSVSFSPSFPSSSSSSSSPSVSPPEGERSAPAPAPVCPIRPAPKRADARPPLPSQDDLIDRLTDWAARKGVGDILADEVERFRNYCLAGKNGKPIVYADYAAACMKWITNPNYSHSPGPRAAPLVVNGSPIPLNSRTARNIRALQDLDLGEMR